MKRFFLLLAMGTLFLTGLEEALAQGPPLGAGPQVRAGAFDPAKVETVAGEVINVTRTTPPKAGRSGQVSLQLRTDKDTLWINLGPAWYLDQQPLKLSVGDRVEVKGVRQVQPRRPRFTAMEVRKGDQIMKLRDDQGLPLWRGQGMGRGR